MNDFRTIKNFCMFLQTLNPGKESLEYGMNRGPILSTCSFVLFDLRVRKFKSP